MVSTAAEKVGSCIFERNCEKFVTFEMGFAFC